MCCHLFFSSQCIYSWLNVQDSIIDDGHWFVSLAMQRCTEPRINNITTHYKLLCILNHMLLMSACSLSYVQLYYIYSMLLSVFFVFTWYCTTPLSPCKGRLVSCQWWWWWWWFMSISLRRRTLRLRAGRKTPVPLPVGKHRASQLYLGVGSPTV